MDVRVGPQRRLSVKELMLLNCSWRLLRVPWTTRRSNQSILKEISPEYSLEGLMLKLQYFGHLMWRTNSWEKTLMLGKIEVRRRRGWQRIRWFVNITISMNMSLSKLLSWWWTGKPGMLLSIWLQRVGHDWAAEQACEAGAFPHQKWQWWHLQGIGCKWSLCSEKSAGQVLP